MVSPSSANRKCFPVAGNDIVCLGIWWVIAKRMVCSEVVVRIRSRLMVVLLSVANPGIASADTAEKLNSYLCDTRAAAVDFAVAAADGTEETARDFVNKKEHREACNRYVGFASVEERGTATINGAVFRTTRYRISFWDHRGDLFAWSAEPA